MKTILLINALLLAVVLGCTAAQEPFTAEPLNWEMTGKPERLEWSKYLLKTIKEDYWTQFSKLKDGTRFCSNYDSMSQDQKINVIANVIASASYYESGWNPKSSSVDVGKKENRDTYSVGLMQVSVVDQKWSGGGLTYKYDDLLKPIPNLHLTLQILSRQVDRRGLIILQNSDTMRYWAVMLEGNQYSKIPEIVSRVKKLSFCK